MDQIQEYVLVLIDKEGLARFLRYDKETALSPYKRLVPIWRSGGKGILVGKWKR